jgi:anti-sigma-K factor RskA
MSVDCDAAAAYVLGALTAAERSAFEAHLAGCEDCRQTVSDMAGIPGLLSRVSPADLADPLPVPDTLVPGLLRAVRRSTRRRRLVVGTLSAAAVLVAITGTAVVVHRSHDTGGPPLTAMSAVVASPVTASAAFVTHPWGTEITMKCAYADTSEWSRPYDLVAVNDQGEERTLATWVVGPSHRAEVSGSVPWPRDHIARVEVRLTSGEPLLRLSP